MKDLRSVQPRSVAAFQILDDIAFRSAKNSGVTRRDAEVVELDVVLALAADVVFVFDQGYDSAGVLATHDEQLCDGFLDDVSIRKRGVLGNEQARVVIRALAHRRVAGELFERLADRDLFDLRDRTGHAVTLLRNFLRRLDQLVSDKTVNETVHLKRLGLGGAAELFEPPLAVDGKKGPP